MSELIKFSDVRDRVVRLRDQDVLLDADVAQLYGVETKEVNKAVRNNPDKFPDGYIFELQQSEKQYVVENFHHLARFEKIARIGVESVSDFAAEIEKFYPTYLQTSELSAQLQKNTSLFCGVGEFLYIYSV